MCWILNVPVSLMFCIFQSSDSVSLDLLTYADLEALRDRKSSSCLKSSHGANGSGRSVALNTKRYLILTYTVEFDRFSIWDHVQILGELYKTSFRHFSEFITHYLYLTWANPTLESFKKQFVNSKKKSKSSNRWWVAAFSGFLCKAVT